ncbi:MAG: hypothetical protein KF812_09895 [Fimbriimonadaceae bacterium]|nr:hypothetical protein [Fimbriimonadaceae bacterium]
MSFRWLVTGYGPFPGVLSNHTGPLALSLGIHAAVLEVSYKAVDAFLTRLEPDAFDGWLALGHDMRAKHLRVEMRGRNKRGRADVRGQDGGDKRIRADGPDEVCATLYEGLTLHSDWMESNDAGDYLCNYVLYQGQLMFPHKKVGFLHLPPVDILSMEEQRMHVLALMQQIEAKRKP